jgi:DNA-binding CsgD family transcriptional regulator
MTRTIADRLSDSAARTFVGRREELALLRGAVGDVEPPFAVAFVHGPGGVGKSRLLQAALAATPPGARALLLDCRDVEPTPRGLIRAIARGLGGLGPEADLDGVVQALATGPPRTVLALNTYEVFGLLDSWVRRVFVPALPDGVVTVVAGREPPAAAWLTGPGWAGLVGEVRLNALGQADAIAMLRSRGLDELQAARANRFARGHPLALELAAAALREDPDLRIEVAAPPAVIDQLLDAVLAGLPAETLETVEAASTARRVTEPILRALLERASVREEFDALRRLPFVERTPEGLLLHDVVRDAVARDLAARDPEAHARYRRRAAAHFTVRAVRPAPGRMWEATADLIYLIQNPVLRDACFPAGSTEHSVEPATAADDGAIREIARAHEAPAAADLLLRWWERHPEAVSVARAPDGTAGAVLCVAEVGTVDPALLEEDPVAAAWLAHLDRVPPRRGDRVLVMRRWLGRESGEMLSPAVAACWLDVKRVYLELRPRLSRLYSVMVEPEALAPIFVPLGFAPVGDPVAVGEVAHQPVWLDFGEGSVDGWLSRLINAEVEAAAEAVPAATADGLSAREVEVLGLIAEGLSNRAIGARLYISEKTVGRHVSNIFGKLGVHTRAAAARIATERGLAARG